LIKFLFLAFGGILIASGFCLILCGGLSGKFLRGIRRRFDSSLQQVAQASAFDFPAKALELCLDWVESSLLKNMIFDVERSSLAAPIVAIVVGLAIPVAATLNMLLGGSSFLFFGYVAALMVVVILAVADSMGLCAAIKQICAGVIVVLWCGVLPLYATWSLTNHFMSGPVHRGVVSGLIIGSFLFATISAIWIVIRAQGQTNAGKLGYGFMAQFIVGVTLFYVGYWLMLLCASLIGDFDQYRGWWTLVIGVLGGALSFSLMLSVLKRSAAAGVIAVAGGIVVTGAIAAGVAVGIYQTAPLGHTTAWVAAMPVIVWTIMPLMMVIFCMFKILYAVIGAWGPKNPIAVYGTATSLTGTFIGALGVGL
jgi:hypothetical protein